MYSRRFLGFEAACVGAVLPADAAGAAAGVWIAPACASASSSSWRLRYFLTNSWYFLRDERGASAFMPPATYN
jgi:hypothetical protein